MFSSQGSMFCQEDDPPIYFTVIILLTQNKVKKLKECSYVTLLRKCSQFIYAPIFSRCTYCALECSVEIRLKAALGLYLIVIIVVIIVPSFNRRKVWWLLNVLSGEVTQQQWGWHRWLRGKVCCLRVQKDGTAMIRYVTSVYLHVFGTTLHIKSEGIPAESRILPFSVLQQYSYSAPLIRLELRAV